jgi:hypothetical protein
MKIVHWGQDYAKLEVNGEEFEISLALAEAIEEEEDKQYREDVRQGRVDV